MAAHFGGSDVPASPDPEWALPRYNIAPTQAVLVAERPLGQVGFRLDWAWWSFLPPRDRVLVNARSETAFEKPTFARAARQHRCLVPADGFFEWTRHGKVRRPHWVTPSDGALWTFAGITRTWLGPDGRRHRGLAILTTEANARLRPLHHRMPVVLPKDRWSTWTDGKVREPGVLLALCEPLPDHAVQVRAVSQRVNRVQHDDPGCLAEPDSESDLSSPDSPSDRQLGFDF